MVKRLKVITQQPKAIENPNIDIKSVTIKHLKISRNLSKIKAKKHYQVGGSGKILPAFYIIKKRTLNIFLMKQRQKSKKAKENKNNEKI